MKVMVVDGERFDVSEPIAEPGVYELRWTSGPHEYGFTTTTTGGRSGIHEELEDAIRNFLSQVDPTTGYIE